MGNIIKLLIFLAVLVVIYFAFAGIYAGKNEISSEIGKTEQNVDNSINNTTREIEDNLIQTANQMQKQTEDSIISAERSFEDAIK